MWESERDCWSAEIHKKIALQTGKDLWRFIQKNSAERAHEELFLELSKLSMKDLRTLSQIHFILSDDARLLVEEVAPAILHRLSKTSTSEIHVSRNGVRGRINWGRTLALRMAGGGDPTLFVSTQRSSVFDLPENRLLLFLLQQISLISRRYNEVEFDNEKFDLNRKEKMKWTERISRLASGSLKLLRNPYVRQIGNLHELTEAVIQQTEKVHNHWYGQLTLIAEKYHRSLNYPLGYIQHTAGNKILEPLNKNTLYEIAVLFKIINAAEGHGWEEQKIGLIGGHSSIASRLAKDGMTLKVFFQGIPKEFSANSNYGDIMSRCGLNESLRRPDIILEWANDDKKRFTIVEVKRSSNRGYIVDGAYKLLGYLKDFENAVPPEDSINGVLVCWAGIKGSTPSSFEEVHISSWDGLDESMKLMFNKFSETN